MPMILRDGELIEVDEDYIAPSAPILEPVQNITYKADIWRRATAQEAEVIDSQINAQAVRERNLFRDALYLSHDDPFFADLKGGFVAAFGETRAGELLAPSE